YVNAGTVEFIVGPEGDFYFMEINTRLQVEHPVTELVTGLDLVEWQLRVAAGERLPRHQGEIESRGHAIEVRLYAEDPAAGFLPGSGKLSVLRLPEPSANVRLDAGVVEGDTVTIHYDPMIAKLIVHDADRPRALARLREALADCEVVGPKSNIAFLENLVRHPEVVNGTIHTAYLDRHLDDVLPKEAPLPPAVLSLAAGACLLHDEAATAAATAASTDPHSPWGIADGWRLGHAGDRLLCFVYRGERIELHARGSAGDYQLGGAGFDSRVVGARLGAGRLVAEVDGRQQRVRARADASHVLVHDGDQRFVLERVPAFRFDDAGAGHGAGRLTAPMPGRVVLVKAAPGQAVAEGEELLVMEAMKMELSLRAPRAGTVAKVQAAAGEFVEADAVLLTLEDA
uniref:ATP-binding protein n=1 Tax=Arenimonas sp. TaxID=1872635 RepID=UPI0025E2BD4C